ncbi:MAG TPA: hypothetical protein VJR29_04495 [bacterium]|nr:hypothetical protein [bacterium]
MTPPKLPKISFNSPFADPYPVEPQPLSFGTGGFSLDRIKLDRFESGFHFDLLQSSPGGFRIPGIFTPSIPMQAAAPVEPPKWNADDTGQLMIDLFMAVDSLDLDLKKMVVNGGEAGCRFSEIVRAKDYPNKETCKNFFEKDTKGDLHLSVRPLEGKGFSELYDFWVLYDKFPGRTGNRINGFYMTHPLNKNDQGPLKVEQEDPFESGKDFRAALNPSYKVPMGTAVPHSDKSSRIIMRPIGFLFDEAPGVSFDISENMLKGWGIVDKKTYTDLGITPFQMPRRMDQLLRFLPMAEAHDPDYVIADGCYDKKPGALVVRPNFLEKKPSLFDALHPEAAVIDILFRKTSIPLGGRGHIDLGAGGVNRIKLQGDAKKTTLEVELGDIPNLRLGTPNFAFAAKGLKAGKIRFNLPPYSELMKLVFPITPPEDPQVVKDRCIDPSSHPKPKRDWQPVIDKLLADVEIIGIKAEELSFEDKNRGLKASIQGAEIKSARVKGLDSILFKGLGAKSLSFEDSPSGTKVNLGESKISSIFLEGTRGGPKVTVKGLEGKAISLQQNQGGMTIDKGDIEKIGLDLSKPGAVKLEINKADSSGEVRYKNTQENYEFRSAGESSIQSAVFETSKDAVATHVKTELKFSGKVKDFFISNPATGDLTMSDTVIRPSEIKISVDLPFDGAVPNFSFGVDIDVEKANLKSGHLPIGEVGASSLKEGKIHLLKDASGLSGKISGELKLQIPQINIPLIEVATKGFSIEGHLKDIVIEGSGSLEITPEKILLTKAMKDGNPGAMKISGSVEDLIFRDDPSARRKELKALSNGSVIKTKMDIATAKIEVKDLEAFEFTRPDADSGRKADLKKLKIKDFSITEIEASAKIWAKFPIFGWLLGKFPLIGKVAGKLPGEVVESELKLESFDTDNNGKGRVTEIVNLLIQLFEVDGRKQMAKFKLPSLKLSPDSITTGTDPIELQLYFQDKDRGGDFEFKLVPEDLSKRDTWKKPKK